MRCQGSSFFQFLQVMFHPSLILLKLQEKLRNLLPFFLWFSVCVLGVRCKQRSSAFSLWPCVGGNCFISPRDDVRSLLCNWQRNLRSALNRGLLSLEMCKYSDCKSKLVPAFAGKGVGGQLWISALAAWFGSTNQRNMDPFNEQFMLMAAYLLSETSFLGEKTVTLHP